MNPKDIPFNLTLLDTKKIRLPPTRQITTREPFEGGTRNFHPNGLFSTQIFGRVGSDERDRLFGYIALNTTILHPFILRLISKIKGLYRGTIEGRSYVIWDPQAKDFIQSDELHGETGMYLFLKHWKEINYQRSESDVQKERAKTIKKFQDIALTDVVWVIPAGFREIQIRPDGRTEENEINDFYRQMISIASTMPPKADSPMVDTSRYALQKTFVGLYDYIDGIISGKKKFIRGSWAARGITNGSRNVLSSMETSVSDLGAKGEVGINSIVVGFYQAAMAVLPVTKYRLRNGWISQVFDVERRDATLVDPGTLKPVRVQLEADVIDRWTSNDGIEKILGTLEVPARRYRPIKVYDMYLGLVYRGPDGTFKIFNDIDELPEGFDRANVSPMTYADWVYSEMFEKWPIYPSFMTRFPVAGEGSSYCGFPYVRTTTVSEKRYRLDDDWQKTEVLAPCFPKVGEKEYVDTLSPSPSRLAGLSGDFDGDMGSFMSAYENTSIKQAHELMRQKRSYVNPDGSLRASPFDYIFELVARNMTGVRT